MSRLLSILGAMSVLAIPEVGHAYNDGASVVGHSGATTGVTCNGCHTGGTAPMVAFSGPATLAAGASGQYTFTVTSKAAADKIAGIDVSVSDTKAQLAAVSATVEAAGGEIVHRAPIPLSGGSVSVQLTLKAPPTGGTITLYGAGLTGTAVDATAGKLASTTKLTITVTGSASVPPNNTSADMGGSNVGSGGAAPSMSGEGTDSNGEPTPPQTGCSVTPGGGSTPALPFVLVMSLIFGGAILRRRASTSPQRS